MICGPAYSYSVLVNPDQNLSLLKCDFLFAAFLSETLCFSLQLWLALSFTSSVFDLP